MKHFSTARVFTLVVTSIVGMAMLGAIAFTVAGSMGGNWSLALEWQVLYIPASVGAALGLSSSPVVVTLLATTQLRKSIPVVYGFSAIPTAVWAFSFTWGLGITAAWPAMVSVILLSLCCSEWFKLPASNICDRCGYDLSGCKDPGCPECGLGRENTGNEPRP